MIHPGTAPDGDLADEQVIEIAATPLRVLHTPGHSPGGVCLYAPALRVVFTGDTLFHGGPGATGPVVLGPRHDPPRRSPAGCWTCRRRPSVHTGHGEDTTIGAESGQFTR